MKLHLNPAKILGRKRSRSMGLVYVMLLALSFPSLSHAGVIAVGSDLAVVATSGRSSFEVIDTASDSQGGTTNTLGTVAANAVSTSAGGTSITSGSAIATWNNAASGQVRFEDLGWDNSAFSSGVVSNSGFGGTGWSYTFQADVTGLFYLNWDISLQQSLADSFGLQNFRFSLIGPSGGFLDLLSVETTGSLTRNIVAGSQYTANIYNNNGIFGGIGGRTAYMDGVFDWSMDTGPFSSVPEPTAIALLGLGLLGLRTNRRRRLA